MGVGVGKEALDALARKLNAAELKAVLDLAERLKRSAAHGEGLAQELEDLRQRLQSAEQVRDFLVEKLKGAEKALKALLAESGALQKQSASDQEIIAFLDLQVQRLEGEGREAARRCAALETALDLHSGLHSSREEELRHELAALRDQHDKLEAAARSQKKVLVKEVRALRQQVDALSQERQVHAAQMALLRDAFALGAAKK